MMIQSFKCKDTQALYEGKSPRKFKAFMQVAERKLAQLEAAQTLDFLKAPPGNRLEAFKGDRKRSAQYSHQRAVAHLLCMVWRRSR